MAKFTVSLIKHIECTSSSSVSSAWGTSIIVAFVQFEPYSRAGVSAMKRPCGDAAIALLGAGPAAPGAGRPGRPFVPFTVHWDSESQSSMLKLWITDRCAMFPVPLNLGILPCFFMTCKCSFIWLILGFEIATLGNFLKRVSNLDGMGIVVLTVCSCD